MDRRKNEALLHADAQKNHRTPWLIFYPVYPAILLLCLNLVDPAAFWKQ